MAEVIGVRFKNTGKVYYFDPQGQTVEKGAMAIVETARGMECGEVALENREVADESIVQPLRKLVRLATKEDLKKVAENHIKEKKAFKACEKKIAERGLEMKLVDVEYTFDNSKILFYFTADGRVDFRELVKDLASVFRARIELRQIGVRDEAKMVGGLGICGRPFCCSQFLDGFLPVSIKMAKTQNLSLNPTKISGTCGRLMCCLKYEQNVYEDAAKRMPKVESFVQTPDGPGNVKSVDLLRETVKVSLDSAPEPLKCYHACEICVLRNGKGSREGIEIPQERPQRYVPQEAREEEPQEPRPLRRSPAPVRDAISIPSVLADEAKEESKSGSRRRRSGRRGGDKARAEKPEGEKKAGEQRSDKPDSKVEKPKSQRPEKKAEGRSQKGQRPEKNRESSTVKVEKVEKTVIRSTGDTTAEKKAAADRAARQQAAAAAGEGKSGEGRSRRRRPRHRSRNKGQGGGESQGE